MLGHVGEYARFVLEEADMAEFNNNPSNKISVLIYSILFNYSCLFRHFYTNI